MQPQTLTLVPILSLCGGACTGGPVQTEIPPNSVADMPAFALGVEYTQVGLAEPYTEAGVGWAKTRLEAFEWGRIELEPPGASAPSYDWRCADQHILAFQQAGMTQIQSYLSPRSEWGSVAPNDLFNGDIMVDPAHEEDFRAWVRALFERYDHDGIDDAPGLLAPVRYWVVGPEWTGFWPSNDHEDYLAFATMVREEARSVYPDVVLGSIPILFIDEFAGNEPTDQEIEARMGPPHVLHNDPAGIHAILDRPDLFEYINVHALGHYTEIPPLVRWFRDQMATRGYDQPLWFDDAFPAGPLANRANFPALYPVTDASYDDVWQVLRSVAKESEVFEPPYTEARDWVRAFYGSHTVKKVVTALGEGVTGVMIGNTEDWFADPGSTVVREAQIVPIGGATMMGMLDVDHAGAYELCDVRIAGERRPAWFNLKLLAEHIGDGDFDARERLGGTEGPRGFRFDRDGSPLWVLWNEDGELHLPWEPAEDPVDYTMSVPAGIAELTLTRSVTEQGVAAPEVQTLAVVGGSVVVSLTAAPVFVRP